LGKALDKEMGGDFEKLIFTCLQATEETYDPGFHNAEKMKEDAEKLYKMGQGKFGTDEAGLFKILCVSSTTFNELLYAEKYGFTLVKAMETEFRGTTGPAAMFMLNMKVKPYEAIANLIETACKGFGTNELLLTCTVLRYQRIMKEVMLAHIELFGKTVQDSLQGEVGGNYRALLMTVLESSDQN
jgi:hypothetical protein